MTWSCNFRFASSLEFARYATVGAVGTLVHYATLVILVVFAAVAAPVAAATGAFTGAVVNYVLNRRVTFRSEAPHRAAIPKFVATAALTIVLSFLVVGAGARVGIHYLLGQMIATAMALVTGYWMNRNWVFARRDTPE